MRTPPCESASNAAPADARRQTSGSSFSSTSVNPACSSVARVPARSLKRKNGGPSGSVTCVLPNFSIARKAIPKPTAFSGAAHTVKA